MIEYLGTWPQLLYPFDILPADTGPLRTIDALPILGHLLEETTALAAVVHAAALHPETYEHDLSRAAHVLTEQLPATLAIFRRWHEDNRAELTGKEDGA